MNVFIDNSHVSTTCKYALRLHVFYSVSVSRSFAEGFIAIFVPRVIHYNIFSILLIHGGLGFVGWGLTFGSWGWGFQLMWFGACGVRPSGFLGLWLSI